MEQRRSERVGKPARGRDADLLGPAKPPREHGLDFFPTPPWATRALVEILAAPRIVDPMFARRQARTADIKAQTALDPACGQGHMVRPLSEVFCEVRGSDVFDYNVPDQHAIVDFLKLGDQSAGLFDNAPPSYLRPGGVDWVITNPPFAHAADFALRGLALARVGVALLTRIAFLEGNTKPGECRYDRLYRDRPPYLIAFFCDRVPMLEGRLARKASSATAYCWLIWLQQPSTTGNAAPIWIPPGTRRRLERDADYVEIAEAA